MVKVVSLIPRSKTNINLPLVLLEFSQKFTHTLIVIEIVVFLSHFIRLLYIHVSTKFITMIPA